LAFSSVKTAIAKKNVLMRMVKRFAATPSRCEYQQKCDAWTGLMVAKRPPQVDVVVVGEAVLGAEASSGRIAPCQLTHIFEG
jgi:hypothetical protein